MHRVQQNLTGVPGRGKSRSEPAHSSCRLVRSPSPLLLSTAQPTRACRQTWQPGWNEESGIRECRNIMRYHTRRMLVMFATHTQFECRPRITHCAVGVLRAIHVSEYVSSQLVETGGHRWSDAPKPPAKPPTTVCPDLDGRSLARMSETNLMSRRIRRVSLANRGMNNV